MGIKFVPVCDKCGYNFEVSYQPSLDDSKMYYRFTPELCPYCREPVDIIVFNRIPNKNIPFTVSKDGDIIDYIKD